MAGQASNNQAAWLDEDPKHPLRVGPADLPVPDDDEIVIKNHAIAINPVDWKVQDYLHKFIIKEWPAVLGTDVAGEVHEVGKNVTKLKKGDRVIGHAFSLATQKPANGGFQLYTAIKAAVAAKIPSNLSFTEASVLPLAIDTAGHGLYNKAEGFLALPYPSLDPKPLGKTILVWGGSSSVGALTIQLATASGAKVVTVAGKHNHSFVKSLGAIEAVDYKDPNVVEDVVKAIQAAGGEFAGIYDAISDQSSFKHTFPIAEKLGGGPFAVVLNAPTEGTPANVKFGNVFAISDVNYPLWEHYVTPALEQGKLRAVPEPLVIGKGLESVQKGLDKNKAGVSAKKVVVEL